MLVESLIFTLIFMVLIPVDLSTKVIDFFHIKQISGIVNTNDSKSLRAISLGITAFLILVFVHLLFTVFISNSFYMRAGCFITLVLLVAALNYYTTLLQINISQYFDPKTKSKRAFVLVIAHPDDECMFFTPALLQLRQSHVPHILCLSNGGYDGLGEVRSIELRLSGQTLGVPRNNIVSQTPFITISFSFF